jgi:hypothetical protein
MCCLRYEDETYDSLKKRLPHKQTRVMTDDGPGTVIDSQILTQLVLVRLDGGDAGQAAYPLENIRTLTKEEDAALKLKAVSQQPPPPVRAPLPPKRSPVPPPLPPAAARPIEAMEAASDDADASERNGNGEPNPRQGNMSGSANPTGQGDAAAGRDPDQQPRRRRRRRRRGRRPGDESGPPREGPSSTPPQA